VTVAKRLLAAAGLVSLLLVGCAGNEPVREPTSKAPVVRRTGPSIIRSPGGRPDVAVNPDQDGPPTPDEIPQDIANTPDAVPKAEPRSPYGNPDSYEVLGQRYEVLQNAHGFRERGYASWYGKKFHGKRTSSGEAYNMFSMTAAHKTLPIPAYARVTNITNGKSVIVKVNDRGPFHSDRIIDLSYAAAVKLDMLGHGSTLVDLEVIEPGSTIAEAPSVPAPAPPTPPTQQVGPIPTPASASSSAPASTAAATPAAGTSPSSGAAKPADAGRSTARFLQAGVFHDPVNAATFRDYLTGLNVGPVSLKSESRSDRWVYRVLIGPFVDAVQLNFARTQLNAHQNPTVPVAE